MALLLEHPVVGELTPYCGPFGRFDTTLVHGLARASLTRIDFLAIQSYSPGQGHFDELLTACKESYTVIGVWAVQNAVFGEALMRRGFAWELGVVPPDPPENMLIWRQE